MTAISALIMKDWIAASSDSLLTEFYPNKNEVRHIEFRKSKIIPIRKFKAAAAYWGLAKIGSWTTYDFLKSLAANSNEFDSFESFANDLRDKLSQKLNSISFNNPLHKGIGIHLIGYEVMGNENVPELFLICNYTDITHSKVGDLGISRNLFKTLPDEFNTGGETLEGKEIVFCVFLIKGGCLYLITEILSYSTLLQMQFTACSRLQCQEML